MLPHRKEIKHFNIPGHARELTFSCFRRLPLLADHSCYDLLASALTRACQKHTMDLLAFVFMPEHVHVLALPRGTPEVSSFLASLKITTSRAARSRIERDAPSRLLALTVQERPGKHTFRFWQEGPGYDRNITSPSTLNAAIDYIHLNPVRRRLCIQPRDWLWSSWCQYHEPEREIPPGVPRISRLSS